MNYLDLGYNSFLIRTILIPQTQSPAEARNAIPTGSLGASQFSMPMNPTTTIVFSSTDYNTAAWAAGIIYFANGTQSLAITAGNTGDITATTYIYYSEDKSPVIQTTTTPLVATGSGKFLLAIVELGVSGKDCKITPTIAAGLVVSGLTAKSISVGQLDALAVNTGTLTVDEAINVGGARIKFDGANNRILVSDANDGRIAFDNDGTLKISDTGDEVTTIAVGSLSFYFNPATGNLQLRGDQVTARKESYSTLSIEHNWTASDSYEDMKGCLFALDGDDLTNQNVYFECVMVNEAASRTAYAQIYNITDSGVVTGSEITSTANPVSAIERVRSSALTIPSGVKEYKLQRKMSQAGGEGDNAHYYVARLVIEQT